MLSQIITEVQSAAEFPDKACLRLYERAKDEQWNVDRDVSWESLQLEQLGKPLRRAMSAIYGQIHFGEVVALSVTARAVADSPELWVKLFGATQVMDEARHVDFFSRVVAKLEKPPPVIPELRALAHDLYTAESFEEQLLGTQIVLEGFAQTVFQEGARIAAAAVDGPRVVLPGSKAAGALLTAIEQMVGRDESRHIAFGVLMLQRRWRDLESSERDRLESRGVDWANRLCGSLDSLAGSLATLGINAKSLSDRVRRAQAAHFRAIGFSAFQKPDEPE